jgi:hypothetical protein
MDALFFSFVNLTVTVNLSSGTIQVPECWW